MNVPEPEEAGEEDEGVREEGEEDVAIEAEGREGEEGADEVAASETSPAVLRWLQEESCTSWRTSSAFDRERRDS